MHRQPERSVPRKSPWPMAWALVAIVGLALLVPAQAQTLRWASQGDVQTLDPHAMNEGLTNMVWGQVYEGLVARDKDLTIVPSLATSWTVVNPTTWRFRLRAGVRFHDGTPLTADDVVFSIRRAQAPTSQVAVYANALGTPVAVDAQTVELRMERFNPVVLEHLALPIAIMSRAWAEKHRVTRPLDFKNREESHASLHMNGTGPYQLVKRQPGVRNSFTRHAQWWGQMEGNVQDIIHTPIANDATRLAALVSGEVDLVLDPAPRDIPRLRRTEGLKVIEGPENRIIFIGMDQHRDELVHGSVKDRNPFKDLRVRQALYHAIDIETLRSKLMNGMSMPTGGITPSPLASFRDPQVETRLPFDLARARQLMTQAGYPDGFEVTLDCPNDRYINDDDICVALAAMWSQIKVRVRVNAMTRSLFFPKIEKFDTSMYMLGWGGAVTDAETTLTPLLRSPGDKGVGAYNYGRVRNDKFDALAQRSSVEPDPVKREALIRSALREYASQAHILPLHRQVIPWAARNTLDVVHRADNWLEVRWVRRR